MPELQTILTRNRDRFVAFLAKRMGGDVVEAEELFQSAILRSLEKGIPTEDEENAVAWFYRVLRNSLIDHYRHVGAIARAGDVLRSDPAQADPELEDTVCACVTDLLPTLKPEYAEIVKAVDLDSKGLPDVAKSLGVTSNNATVRLHRARKALKERLISKCGHCAEGGCLDCSCNKSAPRLKLEPR